jgi:hypothetical protein
MSSGYIGIMLSKSDDETYSLIGPSPFGYSYYGCYTQTASPPPSTGGFYALQTYVQNYSNNTNFYCQAACRSSGAQWAGTVNGATAGGDCYCDNAIAMVFNPGLLITGRISDTNCNLCTSGFGECGLRGSNSISIFARTF